MSVPDVIQHGVQQLQEWLKSLRDNADLADTTDALALLRVVLHQLRDRLTLEEAVDLGQQLPIIVRGLISKAGSRITFRRRSTRARRSSMPWH